MISVIIPVYNAEKTLEKALLSVKKQTWDGVFEVIVVNDGSTDQSAEVIARFRAQHPKMNIRVIHQENGGASKARNAGLQMASHDFIALLDADDEWLPEKTEKQLNVLLDTNLNIDFLSCLRVGDRIRFPYRVGKHHLAAMTFRKLMLRNGAPTPTVIFRKEIFRHTGFFDPDQRYAEDLNYWLRISLNHKMYILNDSLVTTGAGKRSFGVSGLSANLREMERGFQKNLRDMRNLEAISNVAFLSYRLFYKLKYLVRLARHNFYNLLGK